MDSAKASRVKTTTVRRRPAPRGEGGRLREELLAAAREIVAETGDAQLLTLRSVARHVGIAATSLYLHFPDVDALKVALVERGHVDLEAARDSAGNGVEDPLLAVTVRCTAYCRFGVDNPGLYRLMFGPGLPSALAYGAGPGPGRRALDALADSIDRCQRSGLAPSSEDPVELALLAWVALHGLVMLRVDRPHFPWPPLDRMVTDLVQRVIGVRMAV